MFGLTGVNVACGGDRDHAGMLVTPDQKAGLANACVAALASGEFDPECCPLLIGLRPEERARRLAQPWMQACIDQQRVRARACAAAAGAPPQATDHEQY